MVPLGGRKPQSHSGPLVPTANDPDLRQLGAGEREAIALAQQFTASLLIIDEKAAHRHAGTPAGRQLGTLEGSKRPL